MILKQQIPDIIALEIDLLLAKFCSFFFYFFIFHSFIDMFVNAFCAISGFSLSGNASESWFRFNVCFIFKSIWMALLGFKVRSRSFGDAVSH